MFLSFKLYTILQYWTIFYNPSCATRFVTTNINLRYTFPFTAKHFFERKHINTLYVWDVFKCNSVINLIIVNRFFNKKKRGFFYYNGYNVNPAIELLHIIILFCDLHLKAIIVTTYKDPFGPSCPANAAIVAHTIGAPKVHNNRR